jgi:hypothetical protein
VGVPEGRECLIILFEAFNQPKIIIVNHIEKAKGKVVII